DRLRVDVNLASVVAVRDRAPRLFIAARQLDAGDLEVDGVELQLARSRVDAAHRELAVPVHRASVAIERHAQHQALDREGARSAPLRRVAGKRERASGLVLAEALREHPLEPMARAREV